MRIDDLQQLDYEDLAPLRAKIHKEQNSTCPVLKKKIALADTVVDHQHKFFANEEVGKDGVGLVRGVLQRQVNVWEGKITNSFFRLGLHKFGVTIPEALRNLAEYLERDNLKLIHPNEKPKTTKRTLGKRLFAKIAKAYSEKYPKRKPLEYPKMRTSKNKSPKPPVLTKQWLDLMKELNIKE